MSGKIFQNVITQLSNQIDRTYGVVDDKGYVIVSNDVTLVGNKMEEFLKVEFASLDTVTFDGGYSYKPLPYQGLSFEYCAFVEGDDDISGMLCALACAAFTESKISFDEKHNRSSFIKNIISDNILPGDVYVRAKELHFSTDDCRVVILVRQINMRELTSVEVISRLFPDKQNDFVISINDRDIVVVKMLKDADSIGVAVKTAAKIEKQMKEELGIVTNIGISTIAEHLRELADKYKEAQTAIEVGNIFEADSTILRYDSLGLGRIIYQLPTRLCEMFLNEVFKKDPIDDLDVDTLETIDKFFENNLNVSETSRKLYVHRNTLVYRLEKIKKLTGLDLREFDHAIVFKVALMVKMYLDSLGGPKN